MRRIRTLLVVLAVAAAVVVGGTWAYITLIRADAPDRLSLADRETAPPVTGAGDERGDDEAIDGRWVVTDGSQAGYRVDEILFGQEAEAVGRTASVSGELVIDGTTVTSTSIEVDLASVRSDQERRDRQFHGRIMDTATHPTATFELGEPIELGPLPAGGEIVRVDAVGELTLRGTTRPVTIPLEARRSGEAIEVQGALTIVFEEWGIPNPSFGPVSTDDRGELELLVVFGRAG